MRKTVTQRMVEAISGEPYRKPERTFSLQEMIDCARFFYFDCYSTPTKYFKEKFNIDLKKQTDNDKRYI